MLDVSVLNGYIPTRQTGWKFESEDGEPCVCQVNELHGQTATTYKVYNKGDPYLRLESFQDLKNVLVEAGILLFVAQNSHFCGRNVLVELDS